MVWLSLTTSILSDFTIFTGSHGRSHVLRAPLAVQVHLLWPIGRCWSLPSIQWYEMNSSPPWSHLKWFAVFPCHLHHLESVKAIVTLHAKGKVPNWSLHKASHDFPGRNAAFQQLLGQLGFAHVVLFVELHESLAHRGMSLGRRDLGIGITLMDTRQEMGSHIFLGRNMTKKTLQFELGLSSERNSEKYTLHF